uniref:Proteinase-activated receptor 4 n=1 Tax=Pogona vitticeps TaxID=103695 RepID=A0A6J0SPA8_9SAUR
MGLARRGTRQLSGLGPSMPLLLLLLTLLLLCGQQRSEAAVSDYDDYNPNGTDNGPPARRNGLCPRAIPAEVVTDGSNGTFLILPEASRAVLGSPMTVVLLPTFYTLIFLVGLPANALALWVLATRVEKHPSTVFLMNLATADLLLGLLLPLKISYYFLGNHWPFGETTCRFATATFYGNMYCSILLLACISTDRYLAVAHPFFARSCRSPAVAVATCAVVWGVALLFSLPLMLFRQSFPVQGTRQTLCHDALPRDQEAEYYYYYFVTLVACGFLAPLLIIALSGGATLRVLLSHSERYASAVKLTALVLLSVTVCYTPSHVLLLLHYTRPCSWATGTLYVAYMASLALSTCNSCIDPFIYCYVSDEFRAKVKGRLFGPRKSSAISLKTSKETLPSRNCLSPVASSAHPG